MKSSTKALARAMLATALTLVLLAAAVGGSCGWGKIRTLVLSPRKSFAEQYKECNYVSTKGLAYEACDIYPHTIAGDTTDMRLEEYQHIKDGDVVYVVSSCLHVFTASVLPRLEQAGTRIKLVTGSSVTSVPNEIGRKHNINYIQRFLIRSKCIVKWYTQNCDEKHPLIVPIPLGLDYHTLSENSNHSWGPHSTPKEQDQMLESIYAGSKPFEKRLDKLYSFYHFRTFPHRHGDDRKLATDALRKHKFNVFAQNKLKRQDTWKTCAEYKFIVSPHGNGLDCHRTYEAMCLGCVPIVKTSTLDPLYEDMPIIILPSWDQLDIDQIVAESTRVIKRSRHKLLLRHWVDTIRSR